MPSSLWLRASGLAALLAAPVLVVAHGGPRVWEKPATPPGVVSHDVNYTVYDLEGVRRSYTGFVAAPADSSKTYPGVLVAHQWMGLGDMEKFRAEEMASYGYAAFALDVYGSGIRPSNAKEAAGNCSKLEAEPAELHKRVYAGLDLLKAMPVVNTSAIVANGYCFGGVMVLELARTGADLLGVSSFHGEFANLTSQDNDDIKTAVQVHHADLDFQPASALLAFEDEMRSHNVSVWATTKYGNCAHGFTDPTSTAYNRQAASQSHASMRHFYDDLRGLPDQC